MSYVPRKTVKVILDFMAENDKRLEWTTKQLANAGNIPERSVASTLRTAIKHEVVFSERRGLPTFYSLTPYEVDPATVPQFNAARWVDGDVILYGLQEMEGGGVRLPADKVPTLLQLLGSVPA